MKISLSYALIESRIQWRLSFLAALFYLCYFFAGLAPGFLIKQVFSSLSHAGKSNIVYVVVLAMLAVEMGRLILLYAAGCIFHLLRLRGEGGLLGTFMNGLIRDPEIGARSLSPGEVLARLREDVTEVASFLPVLLVGSQGMAAVVSLVLIAHVDVRVALAALMPLLLAVLAAVLASDHLGRHREAERGATAALLSLMNDAFRHIQAVKLSGAERAVQRQIRSLSNKRQRHAVGDLFFSSAINAVNQNLVVLCNCFVLVVAASALDGDRISIGDFALCVNLLATAMSLPVFLSQIVVKARQVKVSIARLEQLSQPMGRLAGPSAGDPRGEASQFRLLEVRGLSYRHPSGGMGLRDVSFEIRQGQLIVIAGSVGGGKSTLLRVLLGLLPKSGGEVLWNGRAATRDKFQPPHTSYVGQTPKLLTGSIRENVEFGLESSGEEVGQAVVNAALEPDLEGLPDGLETDVGKGGGRLSGGQRQRVTIARSLLRKPELLVLDDATSAVDRLTASNIWQGITANQKGVTILAVSSDPALAKLADLVLILEDGCVVARGSYAEVAFALPRA